MTTKGDDMMSVRDLMYLLSKQNPDDYVQIAMHCKLKGDKIGYQYLEIDTDLYSLYRDEESEDVCILLNRHAFEVILVNQKDYDVEKILGKKADKISPKGKKKKKVDGVEK